MACCFAVQYINTLLLTVRKGKNQQRSYGWIHRTLKCGKRNGLNRISFLIVSLFSLYPIVTTMATLPKQPASFLMENYFILFIIHAWHIVIPVYIEIHVVVSVHQVTSD